ncbi:MAG: type 1 glutamine amidotransferase [Betaproteobacteria bacterium]|nr:type 1 glutamine amidotransferase [Betaproteobacteria bacterium]
MRDVPLRIGLSARLLHDPPKEFGFRGKTLQYLEQSIAHWLMAHGALVFMVPTTESGGLLRAQVSMGDYMRALDGLVFQGGTDVSPASYGEEPLKAEWSGDRVRDLYEIDLLWECVIQQKPLLGICRGAQLINVAFGGTLWQDIGTQVPGAMRHVDREAYDSHAHEIELVPGSGLGRLYPVRKRATVTSIHHQAVKELGRGLSAEAYSVPDGIVEAIRWSGASYVFGVQWHPEFHPGRGDGLLDCTPMLDEFLTHALGVRGRTR